MLALSLHSLSFPRVTLAGKEASLSLILKTSRQLSVCALPLLLYPIDTKDEQSLVKIVRLGRSAQGEHWSAKLKYLLLLFFTLRYQTGVFFYWLCIRMPMNKLSVRVHLERDVSMCLSGGKLALTERLFKPFTSLNLRKFSCDAVLVIQLRKQSFALLSGLPLQLLYARCDGH